MSKGQDRQRAHDLVTASLGVIRDGQHSSGAFVAAPRYPPYKRAWLRDGAFCAYAMDLYEQHESAGAFHRFVSSTVLAHQHLFEAFASNRRQIQESPPTRYTLEGGLDSETGETWESAFQLDGYGTWLWMLHEHERRGSVLRSEDRAAAAIVSGYLQRAATQPCYDCWEEFGDQHHASTLATVIAGLHAVAELVGDVDAADSADALLERLLTHCVSGGSFIKYEGSTAVDASLLWLALPFRVVDVDDAVMARTAARISAELTGPTGGVRRYLGDTFYGGGEWILLTAWLAWYRAETGQIDDALRARAWIEASATVDGYLPEQRTEAAQCPEMVGTWERRWGAVATPLLWSHAMYLVLEAYLRD